MAKAGSDIIQGTKGSNPAVISERNIQFSSRHRSKHFISASKRLHWVNKVVDIIPRRKRALGLCSIYQVAAAVPISSFDLTALRQIATCIEIFCLEEVTKKFLSFLENFFNSLAGRRCLVDLSPCDVIHTHTHAIPLTLFRGTRCSNTTANE